MSSWVYRGVFIQSMPPLKSALDSNCPMPHVSGQAQLRRRLRGLAVSAWQSYNSSTVWNIPLAPVAATSLPEHDQHQIRGGLDLPCVPGMYWRYNCVPHHFRSRVLNSSSHASRFVFLLLRLLYAEGKVGRDDAVVRTTRAFFSVNWLRHSCVPLASRTA